MDQEKSTSTRSRRWSYLAISIVILLLLVPVVTMFGPFSSDVPSPETAEPPQRALGDVPSPETAEPSQRAVTTPQPAEPAEVIEPTREAPLSWEAPHLDDPITIAVDESNRELQLDPNQDYRIVMPSRPLAAPGGLVIDGGQDNVLVGGHISIPWAGPSPDLSVQQNFIAHINERRGLFISNATGTVHIEGLLIDGEDLTEGIQIRAPEATVQLQNIRIDYVRARDQQDFTDNHPDLIQPWGGVQNLRIDKFTGVTDYQGIQLESAMAEIGGVTIKRTNIRAMPTARYLMWKGGNDYPLEVQNVWVEPAPGRTWQTTSWPHDSAAWENLRRGVPPGGDFVPSDAVGVDYRDGS